MPVKLNYVILEIRYRPHELTSSGSSPRNLYTPSILQGFKTLGEVQALSAIIESIANVSTNYPLQGGCHRV